MFTPELLSSLAIFHSWQCIDKVLLDLTGQKLNPNKAYGVIFCDSVVISIMEVGLWTNH